MNNAKAIVKSNFVITGLGIILELQHSENGLPKDAELISEKSGLTWTIVARILFGHLTEQKIFDIEAREYMLMTFASLEKRQKSIVEITERESINIFQYVVKAIGHSEKPETDEILIINAL